VTSASLTDERLSDIADTFFGAVSAGDMETVRNSYRPDATIWHNFDNATQTVEENLQLLSWVSQNWVGFHFAEVRRHAIEGGFLQQHTMRGQGPDGTPFESPAVLLVRVDDDGLIASIEEYFHPGQVPLPS